MVKISIAPVSKPVRLRSLGFGLGVVGLAIALSSTATWYLARLPQPQVESLNKGLYGSAVMPLAVAPEGWKAVDLAQGITAYSAPVDTAWAYSTANDIDWENGGLDGTRYPYISDISWADLSSHSEAPEKYSWNGVWRGEGYNRVLDQNAQLVAEREDGVDIYLNVSLDTSITDVRQPNLWITVQNDQNQTAQLTNLSAFWVDKETGETLKRKDFPQLSPVYEVTVIRNGGYAGFETRVLERSGTVTFAYHVSPEQIKQGLPIRLEGVNRGFGQRQQEIFDLQAQGWIVKEVPAASL
jgi:hypothetical protein